MASASTRRDSNPRTSQSRNSQPVALDSHGSDTSFFRNNLIERGGATNAAQAITGSGRFKLIGNHIAGFGEKEASVK